MKARAIAIAAIAAFALWCVAWLIDAASSERPFSYPAKSYPSFQRSN